MNNFEIKLVKYIHDLGKGKIDNLTSFASSVKLLAALWGSIVLITFFYFPNDATLLLQRIVIVAILHFAISEGIFKHILPGFIGSRKRPYVAYPSEIIPIGQKFSDVSMPSSHMASTVAMVIAVSSIFPWFYLPGAILIFFMGFARIHNGMHYPSDVIVGVVLGFIYGAAAIFFV